MATYQPGLTDQIPEPYLYQPDFNFLAGALQRKQGMYEEGIRKVSSTYKSVFENLSNPENIQVRNQYVQDVENKLKDLVSSDLSLPQNVNAANSLFSPLLEDQDLVSDYISTKVMNDALRQGYSYLNSQDEKERAKYWDKGMQYVQNGLVELRNAERGNGSIQRVNPRRYVPNYDVMKFLEDRMGEKGIKIVQTDNSPYGYKVVSQNGDETRPIFDQWVKTELMNNPQALDHIRVDKTVDYENEINKHLQFGATRDQAKDYVAKSFISEQKQYYSKASEEYGKQIGSLQSQLDGISKQIQEKYQGVIPTDDEGRKLMQQYAQLKKQLKEDDKVKTQYDSIVTDYGNPESERYRGDYESMMKNGPEYLQNLYMNQFVKQAGYNLRVKSGVSTTYEIDPVVQMQTKLQEDWSKAILRANDNNNSNGSRSTSGSNSTTDEKNKNEFLPTGTNIRSLDNIDVYNRMQELSGDALNKYVDSGIEVLQNFSHDNAGVNGGFQISDVLLRNLQNAIKTGKYIDSDEFDRMNKEILSLKERNVIPNVTDYNLKKPSNLFSALVDYASNFYKNTGDTIRPGVLDKIVSQNYHAKEYIQLKNIKDKAETRVGNYMKDHPELSQFYANGKFITKDGYLKKIFGTSDKDEIVRRRVGQLMEAGAYSNAKFNPAYLQKEVDNAFENAEKRWNESYKSYNQQLGKVIPEYLEYEGAFAGKNVLLKGPQVESVIEQVLGDANMMKQSTNTGESQLPVNYKQLVDQGADEEHLSSIIGILKGNYPDLVKNGITVSKVGSTGNMAVNIKPSAIQKVLDEKQRETFKSTIEAINRYGLEFEISDEVVIPQVQSAFTMGLLENKLYDDYASIKAPGIIKSLGFDYYITKTNNNYLITIQYPYYQNGVKTTQSTTMEKPVQTSLRDLETNLLDFVQKQLAENKSYEANTRQQKMTLNPQPSTGSWAEYKNQL